MRAKRMRNITLVAVFAVLCPLIRAATDHFGCGASGISNYIINGVPDPDLTLVRGFTYTFNIDVSSHPFWIKTTNGKGVINSTFRYDNGVSNNGWGTAGGVVTFAVATNEPNDQLCYQCGSHSGMNGFLNIVDPPDVVITDFNVGTNAFIVSTGTDALNINVQLSTNLTSNVWANAVIQSNSYANGTNSTQVALPTNDASFFRVQQGFFNP